MATMTTTTPLPAAEMPQLADLEHLAAELIAADARTKLPEARDGMGSTATITTSDDGGAS
ncbi:hypothetical protein [Dongia sp.]|uniref:hypothetical protein n=1 Tax=Dongia sp. TaxID=1977262 RepID=UPI0035ADFC57